MINIAIFSSGSGSNAENFVHFFKNHTSIRVSLILCNNPNAFVLERAKKLNVPSVVFTKNDFYASDTVEKILTDDGIDFIILAGFLWLVPVSLIEKYPHRILNIHPALLPRYGGKGMYGERVHCAVKQAGDLQTGITIHLVNHHFDEGQILFQSIIGIEKDDSVAIIAEKVHAAEYRFYPQISAFYISGIYTNL
jgi:phosphoribosylglycinamide formyltransferase-1